MFGYCVSFHKKEIIKQRQTQTNDEQDEQSLIFLWLAEREFAHFCCVCVGFCVFELINIEFFFLHRTTLNMLPAAAEEAYPHK